MEFKGRKEWAFYWFLEKRIQEFFAHRIFFLSRKLDSM
ncbi:hypothetical protein C943_04367 [Mariniradius saccharolyticus AK6]|uniref:Uncharacterized protein n=1 Tax=Mariniradius saccharolyticus AK6 TaxID=1239962 RepID=M7XF50_9BACT|nr:hypothetical protein C943_04367 [Mariniradius saccharolyticus AK6]